jgi:hypothetical protein
MSRLAGFLVAQIQRVGQAFPEPARGGCTRARRVAGDLLLPVYRRAAAHHYLGKSPGGLRLSEHPGQLLGRASLPQDQSPRFQSGDRYVPECDSLRRSAHSSVGQYRPGARLGPRILAEKRIRVTRQIGPAERGAARRCAKSLQLRALEQSKRQYRHFLVRPVDRCRRRTECPTQPDAGILTFSDFRVSKTASPGT